MSKLTVYRIEQLQRKPILVKLDTLALKSGSEWVATNTFGHYLVTDQPSTLVNATTPELAYGNYLRKLQDEQASLRKQLAELEQREADLKSRPLETLEVFDWEV